MVAEQFNLVLVPSTFPSKKEDGLKDAPMIIAKLPAPKIISPEVKHPVLNGFRFSKKQSTGIALSQTGLGRNAVL